MEVFSFYFFSVFVHRPCGKSIYHSLIRTYDWSRQCFCVLFFSLSICFVLILIIDAHTICVWESVKCKWNRCDFVWQSFAVENTISMSFEDLPKYYTSGFRKFERIGDNDGVLILLLIRNQWMKSAIRTSSFGTTLIRQSLCHHKPWWLNSKTNWFQSIQFPITTVRETKNGRQFIYLSDNICNAVVNDCLRRVRVLHSDTR